MRGRLTAVALPAEAARAVAPPRLVADPVGGAIAAWAEGSDLIVSAVRDRAPVEELFVGCSGPPLSIALAASKEGGTVVVWSGHDGTVLACVREGRTWRGPAPLTAPAGGATLVDAAASGDEAVAVWTTPSGVAAARHRPGDGWVGEGRIGPPGAVAPRVALGPAGETVAAWVGAGSQVSWAARPPGGDWAPGADLTPLGHGAAALRLAAAPDGAAVMTWTAADAVVRAARLPFGQLADGGEANWHTAPVSSPGDACYAPRLAVGPAGALVAWHRVDARIQASLIDPGGRPGCPAALTDDARAGLYPCPALGDGAAVVAWRGGDSVSHVARLGADGWSAPRALPEPGGSPEAPLVAVDSRGAVVVVH